MKYAIYIHTINHLRYGLGRPHTRYIGTVHGDRLKRDYEHNAFELYSDKCMVFDGCLSELHEISNDGKCCCMNYDTNMHF